MLQEVQAPFNGLGFEFSSFDENDVITIPNAEQYTYKLTFIPRNETPFSDAQIVIALFQG